jgi:hypothetical protein
LAQVKPVFKEGAVTETAWHIRTPKLKPVLGLLMAAIPGI